MKQYIGILVSFFCSEISKTLYFVTIAWLLYQVTGRADFTGLLVSLGFLPSLLSNIYIGVIVDRFSTKLIASIALIGNLIAVSLMFASLSLGSLVPIIVFSIHMFQQLMGTVFRTTLQAHSAKSFPPQQLPKVIAYTNAVTIFGALIGASVGGWLIRQEWLILTVSLIIGFYLLAVVTVNFINSSAVTNQDKPKKTSLHRQLIDGLHYLIKHPFLFRLFSMTMVGQLVYHTSIGFLSVYTIDHINEQATTYGWLDATLSVGGGLAGLVGFWWFRKTRQFHTVGSLILTGAGLLILALPSNFTFPAFIGVSLIGLGTTWIRVLLQSTQQILTARAYHGRMSSYRMLINHGSIVISAPFLGWIANQYRAANVYAFLLIPVVGALIIAILPRTLSLLKQAVTQSLS
ncbi:Major Facilitator Superfamily protein [Amphibacillus marinus]|uniref:Major Facilitator Superfamily protein n=1 Tax=Amphibacillus marinus TaxID=872970 RepID=A0A1H8JSV8_9BACI|nr:MFS transporter [Amphibacillus marinus]SEN83824.1 Major Facilitator Superfamily protein [Amphibacillus marinus]